jgi:predicted N-acetyltransferase YhbS
VTGGLDLRPAQSRDLDQIGELLADRGEPADAVDLRLVVEDVDGGFEQCAVVVDGDRVVSTLTLLDETLVVGGISLPAGQVELVATHPGYEGRGLVRSLMAWAHERSAARGHLLQVMIGIPYFYRQFGYAYALPIPTWRTLDRLPSAPDDVVVRRATASDIEAMHALQDMAQADADVQLPHTAACWRWLVARDGSQQWVAERAGVVVGVARTLPPEEGARLGELAAAEPAAALALVAHAGRQAEGLAVQDRPGTKALAAVEPYLGRATEKPDWYYARVEHLAPLLDHLAPLLGQRLAAAGLADREHDVLLSTWRAHVCWTIGPEGMSPVVAGGAEQRPISKGGSGLPPDAVPHLLLGPYGALGLEERLPDCLLGRQRDLMAALFPPVTADLLTFYLP